MAPPRTPAAPKTVDYAGRPVAILRGGPRDRVVYFVADIEAQREAQRRTGHGIFDYAETGQKGSTTDGYPATFWDWAPPAPPVAPAIVPAEPEPPPVPAARKYTADLDPTPCPTCGEPTLRVEHGKHVLVVDPEMVKGGLWRFDSRGRPVRRPLSAAYADPDATGYGLHECPSTPSASPAAKD